MPRRCSIAYNLGQHGWSSFKLTIGNASVDIGPFGYCTDALGDLIRAALVVAASGDRAEVSFDGEPHEWRLIADWYLRPETHPPVRFRVRVLTFRDIYARSPEADGQTIFEAEINADEFARTVERAAQTIWDRYGADGYHKAWGTKAFPLRALQALKVALATEEPTPPPPDRTT
jgi:hypothetical protein